jgi:hypothetical protein
MCGINQRVSGSSPEGGAKKKPYRNVRLFLCPILGNP